MEETSPSSVIAEKTSMENIATDTTKFYHLILSYHLQH